MKSKTFKKYAEELGFCIFYIFVFDTYVQPNNFGPGSGYISIFCSILFSIFCYAIFISFIKKVDNGITPPLEAFFAVRMCFAFLGLLLSFSVILVTRDGLSLSAQSVFLSALVTVAVLLGLEVIGAATFRTVRSIFPILSTSVIGVYFFIRLIQTN